MDNINTIAAGVAKEVPNIIGAIVVLVIGWILAGIIGAIVRGGLRRAGLDRFVDESHAGSLVRRVTKSPARAIGRLAFWLVLLGAISLAVSVLGIPALTGFVAAIYAYLPNVIAAVLILLVAIAVSAVASGLAVRLMGDTPTGKLIAGIVPGVIFSVAIFMVLEQLKIAPAVVIITYTAIIGSVALGAALAFGLGGRDMAAQMLSRAQVRAQDGLTQAREDLATGRARGEAMAEQAKSAVAGEDAGDTGAGVEFKPAAEFGERIQQSQRPHRTEEVDSVRPADDNEEI